MPTGYTADVQDGKITDFPTFALLCARAFGALVTMRDDPLGAPVPEEFQPSQHYAERARAERDRLDGLLAMTPDEIEVARNVAEEKRAAAWAEANTRATASAARYEAMLAAAEAWEPPSEDHTELKAFMIQQLKESIRFDCGPMTWGAEPLPPPAEWHAKEIKAAADALVWNVREQHEENERVATRNAWVRLLRQSLTAKEDDRE
jgi:hypothetical protein